MLGIGLGLQTPAGRLPEHVVREEKPSLPSGLRGAVGDFVPLDPSVRIDVHESERGTERSKLRDPPADAVNCLGGRADGAPDSLRSALGRKAIGTDRARQWAALGDSDWGDEATSWAPWLERAPSRGGRSPTRLPCSPCRTASAPVERT